jgi:hypothetical protein
MDLAGQHTRRLETGYVMAGLLVALAVMSVMMAAVLPAWRHQAKREKEAELVFRGEQYIRAIGLWERKMGPGARPPNIDILVQQRFLRKKYKDPMSADGEFQPIFLGASGQLPGGPQGPGVPGQGGPGQSGRGLGGRGGSQPAPATPGLVSGVGPGGGLYGVVSKSKEESLRLYKNRNHYNEWQFSYAGAASAPGAPGGSATPGGRGGQPTPGLPGRGRGRGTGPGGGGLGPGGREINPGVGFPRPAGPGGRGRGPGGN